MNIFITTWGVRISYSLLSCCACSFPPTPFSCLLKVEFPLSFLNIPHEKSCPSSAIFMFLWRVILDLAQTSTTNIYEGTEKIIGINDTNVRCKMLTYLTAAAYHLLLLLVPGAASSTQIVKAYAYI